jgi:hypothetical protein
MMMKSKKCTTAKIFLQSLWILPIQNRHPANERIAGRGKRETVALKLHKNKSI